MLSGVVLYPQMGGLAYSLSFPSDISLEHAKHFFHLNQYDSALHHYNLAASNFKAQNNWKKYIEAVAGKAYVLVKLRRYDDAKVILDAALVEAEKWIGESPELATVYYVYGVLRDYSNRPEESLLMHQKALEMRKALLGANHFLVSESYNGIGEVYRYTIRDYIEAEKYFKLSVNILEPSESANQEYLYQGYYNLATTNRLKNDFEKALGFAFNAVRVLETIKPVDTTAFIRCNGIIANIYNDLEVFDKSIEYYRKALKLRLARKEMSSETANDFVNLSLAYIKTSNFQKALYCVDSALGIMTRDVAYDSAGIANIYMIKGKALREAGRLLEAMQNYQRSLAIQKKFTRRNVRDISNLYRHLSDAMYKNEQYDSALNYIQRCIQSAIGEDLQLPSFSNPAYEQLANKPELYFEIAHKGAVLVKLAEKENTISRLTQAVECFQLSDRLMDIYWDFQESENSKLFFAQSNYYIYEMALSSIYKLYKLTANEKYKEIAFLLEDKSKARILRQGAAEAREYAKRNMPDSLLSEERNIKTRIGFLQNRLGSLEKNNDDERALNMELIAKQKELAVWKEKIKARFPQYVIDTKNFPEMSLQQLKASLSGDMVFIEYFFGEKMVYAFASFQGNEQLISIENKGLQERIHKFCGLLSKGLLSRDRQDDFREYTSLAFGLYNELLLPAFTALNVSPKGDGLQMLIIPDGALSLLPFQALIASHPQSENVNYKNLDYLVRHFTISYSFDATSSLASPNVGSSEKGLLAFGWSDGIERTANDLPGTYHELRAIAEFIPGKFVMGAKAVKETFMKEAPVYNILHLAIHGVGKDDDIYNNYLQFRDKKLYAHELYGYRLNANLTVLSACETGYGKVFTAEGVYSIARAFFYAGSKSLLMTLWPINDGESVPLIREFYKSVEQKEYASRALRMSQLEYLENVDEYAAHPRFWAGFVLWGSYKEVNGYNSLSLFYIGMIFIIMVTLTYMLFRTVNKSSDAKIVSRKMMNN